MGFVWTRPPQERLSRPRQVIYVIIIVVFGILIYDFSVRGMRSFLVPSRSMEPALLPKDYLLTFNEKTYERGDIVVLIDPEDPKSYIVKRIVATGGDTLSIDAGALYLNGRYVSEPYISEPMQYQMEQVTVPDGEVFVLGDNRNLSDDSSRWKKKTLSVNTIVGRVHYIFLPPSRMRKVDHFPLVQPENT